MNAQYNRLHFTLKLLRNASKILLEFLKKSVISVIASFSNGVPQSTKY